MLSSIFGNSKPINYIIILGFLALFYVLVGWERMTGLHTASDILVFVLALSVLLFSIMVVNFIVKRNQITGSNDYAILFFSLLIVLFHEVLLDYNAIMGNFFLLLALRRLISLKSLKNIKLKLFDASFWIAVGSLFYDWMLLYIVLVYISLYIYEPKNIRNWLVPIIAMACAAILIYSVRIISGDAGFIEDHYSFEAIRNSNILANPGGSVKMLIYLILVVIAGIISFVRLGKLGMGKIVTMRLVVISFIIGLVVTVLKSSEEAAPIMLTFFPASILFTKYIEVIKRANIKEVVLILSLVIPFMVFLAEWIAK